MPHVDAKHIGVVIGMFKSAKYGAGLPTYAGRKLTGASIFRWHC
jgi:hypothetical protein